MEQSKAQIRNQGSVAFWVIVIEKSRDRNLKELKEGDKKAIETWAVFDYAK